jgi:hypothetical protein
MRLEEVVAREEIRYTIELYNSIGDRAAYDDLPHVYTEDAQWIYNDGTVNTPLSSIIAASKAGAAKRGAGEPGHFQRHLLGHSVINLRDDGTASTLHYLLIMTELGPDHAAVYRDEFRKVGDRWLIAKRTNALEWIRPDSRFAIYGTAKPMGRDALDVGFKLPPVGTS